MERMTADEIAKMSDREVEQCIASRVFGYQQVADGGGNYTGYGRNRAGEFCIIPHWATDVGLAFSVVGEMRNRGWLFFTFSPGSLDGEWSVNFQRHGSGSRDRDHRSLPRAICECALLALAKDEVGK